MSKLIHPECLNDDAKTLDCYIADYLNNADPDLVGELIEAWIKLQESKKERRDVE